MGQARRTTREGEESASSIDLGYTNGNTPLVRMALPTGRGYLLPPNHPTNGLGPHLRVEYMRNCFLSVAMALTAISIAGCAAAPRALNLPARSAGPPHNVILFVADGAGAAHWTLALHAEQDLAIRRFEVGGLVDTRGANHVVTGSAASASALATGERTFFGAISVSPDSVPLETVAERAMSNGLAAGVMTTTAIWDATPAAFTSHATARGQVLSITTQMARKGLRVMMGGGRRAFLPDRRPDSLDLREELRRGYTYVETAGEFYALDLDTVTSLAGLFAPGDMGPTAGRSPALPDMVDAALTVLNKDPDGFFLLVENEETDSRAHANDAANILVADMLQFDAAVGVALAFRERNPQTLIVVTGDHETGGISLPRDSVQRFNSRLHYSTGDHTAVIIPIFATGPGAEQFGGLLENREVGRLLLQAVTR